MVYATIDDLVGRFGDEVTQLTDAAGAGMPDAAVVARALTDADSEINAALQGRYQLPLLPVPDLLNRVACDLARESLFVSAVPGPVADRAKVARSLLADLAAGRRRLDVAAVEAGGDSLVEIQVGRRRWPF